MHIQVYHAWLGSIYIHCVRGTFITIYTAT